uniref:Transmembrane protein n=1 Tax=Heterorhabditis bacteriophora TaxID=37862 RepID=A0A1I7WZM8_HETBA
MSEFEKDMSETAGSKMCSYMYAVSCFFISEIILIFGYQNNAWLVIHKTGTTDEFQISSLRYNEGSLILDASSLALYLALYLARLQLLFPMIWFFISIICCCNLRIEQFAYNHKKILIHICAFGAFIFICIFVIMMISLVTNSVLPVVPPEYDVSSGYLYFKIMNFNSFKTNKWIKTNLQQEQELQTVNA